MSAIGAGERSVSGELILFLICGFLGLLSAFATVTVRSPIRAAMALLGYIVVLAALYVACKRT
jgi:NADH:ubiquinone oxidoreductase subunit 6 (subunit J)